MWALVLTSLLAAGPEMEARTLDDRSVRGVLVELTAEGVVLETADGAETIEIDDLLALVPSAAGTQGEDSAEILVEFVDGASLGVTQYDVHDGDARLALNDGQTLKTPTTSVAAVRFNVQSPDIQRQWDQIAAANSASDVLVLRKENALDFLEGVLGDSVDDGQAIEFTLGDTPLRVKRTKIEGLIYAHPAGRALREPVCVVVDSAGRRLPAASYELVDGELHITTPAGLSVRRRLNTLARLDFSRGKVQYLSDMKPESVDWTAYFGSSAAADVEGEFFRFRADRGLHRKELRLAGKSYDRGLALHSRTQLVYRLDGRWNTLRAIAGIDDAMQGKGNVRLVLRGDDRVVWEQTITGRDEPVPISLDLSGVRRLTILVDFGDDLDVADHLNLCEARIIK